MNSEGQYHTMIQSERCQSAEWSPVILSEEPVPISARDCECCELYKQGTRMVWGEGNPKASIMLILDNPGAREDRDGHAFVCGTRATLQQGLRTAGLTLDEVYVTYILKRRPVRAYDKPATRQSCLRHLHEQLTEKQPKLLVGFGNVVSETLFAEGPVIEVKLLRGKWHEYQHVPIRFTYHPLAVRRRPNLWNAFNEDLMALAERWRKTVDMRS